ncbi:preprotein translocase subunit SecA [Legionella sp. WA2022007384]
MQQYSQNKYIQSLLENLITSYETEINYTPLQIELDSKQIVENDIDSLINFLNDDRKRLFIFKIPENQQTSNRLGLLARRIVLNKTAETLLKNTSSEPKINPLKYALSSNSPAVRARIQIQKSIVLPAPPSAQEVIHLEQSEHVGGPELNLVPIESTELPELIKQLKALGIDNLQESALPLIKEHSYAFGDGIIPGNLPKGFHINKDKKALCYTDAPRKLPSALAPVLKKQESLTLPSIEEITALLPHLPQNTLSMLVESKYSPEQKNTLLSLVPANESEIKTFLLQLYKSNGSISATQQDEFIIPLLCKQYVLGGEAHTILLVRLLIACLNKKIDIEFLKNPETQNSLLSTRGIKNLQKLIQLPAEQKEWWNTLVKAHLEYDKSSFDFNTFFDAYTQTVLPRIAEKSLTLPNPCPIHHKGHFLITLNRVLDVIEHAKNPQEQCLSLSELNWGSTGVHYAMLQKPASEQFKQVAGCMYIDNPEDTITDPEPIYQKIDTEPYDLKPWLFRYMGQHWKSEIRLTDIQAQLREIEKLASWTSVQKNQLAFILTCTFANNATLEAVQWKETLSHCIHSLQGLDSNDRTDLLQAFSRCFAFKPTPSLMQIKTLMKQCIEFKTASPNKKLKDDFIVPLVSCLENEGFELLNTLQERIQKTAPDEVDQFSLEVTASFSAMLQKNRQDLSPEIIKLFAKLNEPDLTQENIDKLLLTIRSIQDKKGDLFHHVVLSTLSQINISKSQILPKAEQIQTLLELLANSADAIPPECKTLEKQEAWLKALIIEHNPFPGCVLGNGDISKLDDLIVDALVDAIKKRSAVFKIDVLKEALQKNLNNFIVPQQLRDQLNAELIPLFDAVNELVILLQTPNPKFPEVIEKLQFFEEKKPILLEGMYKLFIGETKGEYILSFLLTGKRKATDQTTNKAFAAVLGPVHSLFVSQMKSFFDNPLNEQIVKDLDLNTCLSWMAAFNDTHSLTFFFKEELIQKKVLPALKKTLQQLNTQDVEFEKSILDEAALIDENAPADQALQGYKNKIESIANYLNLLIEINDRLPQQFIKIYKQLNTGSLARLNYQQKHTLVNKLISNNTEKLDLYLKLATQTLEEHPNADNAAIGRAVDGLVDLFNLPDLEPETQTMFFKMSMAHNLKSTTSFPLAALNKFKNSDLPEQTKSLIIKQIIQILAGLSTTDSGLIQELVEKTQVFLTHNIDQPELCIALLNRISQDNAGQNLSTYPHILEQLAEINPGEKRAKVATILTGLAKNKKDSTVSLASLLEITKGLKRRLPADVDQVLKLFTTPPYPNAQSLNTALLAHDSEKINAYYLSFDTNPFAKTGEKRDLVKQFATDRIKDALINLQDLLHEEDLPHSLHMKLAKQLTFIETLGYTDPLNPGDFTGLKGLTATSRHDLKVKANALLQQLRTQELSPKQREVTHLELLAYLREIYFRTTGLFPNTTQMLVLLLALEDPSSNLLMRIKTGEGKSINTPMLSVLQWAQGGTVVQWTANPTLLIRDYENSCEPFFDFLGIKSALIKSNSSIDTFVPNGINCSTVEDMACFHLTANNGKLLETNGPVHIVLDECDDALLDQVTLYKLVAEAEAANTNNPAQWIYPLAYQFINQPGFRNLNPAWDEDEDLDQFRRFLNKQINEQFNGDVDKQNYLMASSNTQMKQWIHASCIAAKLVENKHFIMQPLKEKNEAGHEITKKIACVPLIRSTPKTGSIFTESVQQALQARLKAERKDQAQYIFIDTVPSVLGSQSAQGLVKFFQKTLGRLLGISATPGDKPELESLATSIGTQAISVAPYAGDRRINHPPIFTLNRGETIKAIHETLKKIKLPVTKPTMEINPDETILPYDETLIVQRKIAIEKWSHTQTQPILIVNEDFDEAQAIGNSLKIYEEQGFKIQILTGKESAAELDKIIKQAGQANTITVGTSMLAKGIDINTGDHPKGLFVIQTYPDTERMTTQIAGRAARNGKPGEWLPIYQVKAPEDLLNKFFYYVFPWTRQRINEHTIEEVRDKIKLQATVDRTYTQAIDEAQQILMSQIEAWESLLLELYHDDPKIRYELYQWRELLLSELTRSQDTSVSEHSLYESIAQFKKSACKFWESAREEKWAAKAAKAPMTSEQGLRFKYLKELDFFQELNIQTKLKQKSKHFTAGTTALMHQNIETVIADKAGAVLEYSNPSEEERKNLELAQSRQILPNLIGEFCAVCPSAIKVFFPKNSSQNASYIPEIVRNGIDKLIEQKNKVLHGDVQQEVSQSIIQFYQKKLKDGDREQIRKLLTQMKPLILNRFSDFTKFSLVEQFKMQGLILSFSTLYRNLDMPADANLNDLQMSYDAEIMKKLAEYLLHEFAWVKENPVPFHALFERSEAKKAALDVYNLANNLKDSPQDQEKIRDLYTALQQHKVNLKDKYLFSISHSSPRKVINNALDAIDSLNNAPHCDLGFRQNCHDKVVSEHQIAAFRKLLTNTSPYFFKTDDPTWEHMKQSLLKISNQSKENPSHIIHELYEATVRFSTYKAYQPYLNQLSALQKQLLRSVEELGKDDGLNQDVQESLFTQKQSQFAALLKVDPQKIRIQNGTDGIQSYIELQIEDGALQEGFTGYQSSFLTRVDSERNKLKTAQSTLERNKDALLKLADEKAIEALPERKHAEFNQLFRLKALSTQNWNNINIDREGLPDLIRQKMKYVDEMKQWNWKENPVDQNRLRVIFGKIPNERFSILMNKQARINDELSEIRIRIQDIKEKISAKEKEIADIDNTIKDAEKRMKENTCSYLEKGKLTLQNMSRERSISSMREYIRELIEEKNSIIREEETECLNALKDHNDLLDKSRAQLITELLEQTKLDLASYLDQTAQEQVALIEKEFSETEPVIERIEKEERQKTCYQTRRFFKTSELLRYEASLAEEEAKILLSEQQEEAQIVEALVY